MADIADQAQVVSQEFIKRSLEAQRVASATGIIRHEDCISCGDPISIERQKIVPGTAYCAYCQSEREA